MPTVYLRRTSQCVHFKAASGLWFLNNLDNLNFLYSVNAPMHLIRNIGISASSGNPLKRCRTRAKVLLQPKAKLICTLMWAPPLSPNAWHSNEPLLSLLLIFSLLTTQGPKNNFKPQPASIHTRGHEADCRGCLCIIQSQWCAGRFVAAEAHTNCSTQKLHLMKKNKNKNKMLLCS